MALKVTGLLAGQTGLFTRPTNHRSLSRAIGSYLDSKRWSQTARGINTAAPSARPICVEPGSGATPIQANNFHIENGHGFRTSSFAIFNAYLIDSTPLILIEDTSKGV